MVCGQSSSLRATGMPDWMAWITVFTADWISGKLHTAADMASCSG